MKYNLTQKQRFSLPFIFIMWLFADPFKKKSWHEVKKGMEKHDHKFTLPVYHKGYNFLGCNHTGCYDCAPVEDVCTHCHRMRESETLQTKPWICDYCYAVNNLPKKITMLISVIHPVKNLFLEECEACNISLTFHSSNDQHITYSFDKRISSRLTVNLALRRACEKFILEKTDPGPELKKQSDFEKYILNARAAFVQDVADQHWSTKMRVSAENILIAYDQLRHKVTTLAALVENLKAMNK